MTKTPSTLTEAEIKDLVKSMVKEQVYEMSGMMPEEPRTRRPSMTWGQMPPDELLAPTVSDWHMRLGRSDRLGFDLAMKMAGLNPMQAEMGMNTLEGMKLVINALINCDSTDPKLAEVCEHAHSLAGAIMDQLGFEWI